MNPLLLMTVLVAGWSGQWRTLTNTNFVTDLTGIGDTLYLATTGGLQPFRISDSVFLPALTNADGLTGNSLTCCASDAAGRIWLGTNGGGLVRYDPGTGAFAAIGKDDLPFKINCLVTAGDTVLVGTDNGAWRVLPDRLDYVPGLASLQVISVGKGRDFWAGGNQGADRILPDLRVEHYPTRPGLLGDTVKGIVAKADTLFIATEWCIARFSDSANGFVLTAAYQASPPETRIVRKLALANGRLHVAHNGGIYRLVEGGYEPVWTTVAQTLFGYQDLWVGLGGPAEVMGSGLGRLRADGAVSTYSADGLVSSMINAAVTDTAGVVYADHFLTVWGLKQISRLQPDGWIEVLTDTFIHACLAARDSRNRIWFGHWALYGGGVSWYDPATGLWDGIQWGPGDYRNVICALGIDRFDNTWLFNQSGELVVIDTSRVQGFFRLSGVSAPPGGGYDFAFDSRDRVWFGNTAGLAMFDFAGTLHDRSDDTTALYDRGLATTNVLSTAIDNQGRPWVATGQGAGVLEGTSFRMFTTSNSRIPSNNVARVRVDSWGNVWVLTDKGLSIYDPRRDEWSQPDSNRLIPNLGNRSGFYTWLELNEAQQQVVVGTQAGLGIFRFEVPADSSLEQVVVGPNPFVPSLGQREATFDRLPELNPDGIRIYTLSGELVIDSWQYANPDHLKVNRTYHRASWDGRNRQGREVASGLYLVVLSSGRERRVVRVAVVR